MEIRRDFYLNKLITKKNNGLIKVITGIRRCGKSYLLNRFFYHHLLESGVDADHIIRFAFDSADDLYLIGESLIQIEKEKRGVDPEKFMAYIRSRVAGDGMYYLLLDEVQLMDCFESVLNGYLRKDNMDVFVTGSNAKFLSKDIVTEFAGRGDEVHMYPLSFAEFMSVYKGDKYMGLSEYMLYGGIPLVVLREGANDKAAALQNLFSEIYIRDILKRNRIKNIGELEDLLNILSSAIGSLTNPEKLKNTFKTMKKSRITSNTIKKYLSYFEDSFLLESAQRYDIKGKRYINSLAKYDFTDLGLRNALLGMRQQEETHIMENVLYNELRRRGCCVDVGVVEKRTMAEDKRMLRQQLEVDFVVNYGSHRCYIQSARMLPEILIYKHKIPFLSYCGHQNGRSSSSASLNSGELLYASGMYAGPVPAASPAACFAAPGLSPFESTKYASSASTDMPYLFTLSRSVHVRLLSSPETHIEEPFRKYRTINSAVPLHAVTSIKSQESVPSFVRRFTATEKEVTDTPSAVALSSGSAHMRPATITLLILKFAIAPPHRTRKKLVRVKA